MQIGILGGGMQGCCCALALAERGVDVVLFDRNERLLSRTAVANEGKVHLGYMYANDPGLSTAGMMMQGALAFAPFFERTLGTDFKRVKTSKPAAYVVHRDSQRSVGQISNYLSAVHTLIEDASQGRSDAYFGRELTAPLRRWEQAELEVAFDPEIAMAVFDSPEVAINPVSLANAVCERVNAEPRIEVRLAHEILAVSDTARPEVVAKDFGRQRFDHVINALWDGRLAIDDTLGLRPRRPWLHRLKYGVSFCLPPHAEPPPSATFISGPFGEVVSYGDGITYLTWYPVCLLGMSPDLLPPEWPTHPPEPSRSQISRDTLSSMAEFVLPLRDIHYDDLSEVSVKGGVIVAWGETDIDDPTSELHRRYEIGVTTNKCYHSVDPGKLTMAPYFAQRCAHRILGTQ